MQTCHRSGRVWPALFAVLMMGMLAAVPGAQRGKPAPQPTGAITFADRTGDAFRSDASLPGGSNTYVNGSDGAGGSIEVSFYATGSQDLTVNLIRSYRKFVGAYAFVGCPDGSTGDRSRCNGLADGSFNDGWFINVHKIADLPPGWTQWTTASFTAAFGQSVIGGRNPKYETRWVFSWCHNANGLWSQSPDRIDTLSFGCGEQVVGKYPNGWQMVKVTRSPNHANGQPNYTWTVSADPIDGTPIGDMSGLTEFTKTNAAIPHGFYRTRFQLSVSCTSGCSQLPD